MVLKSDEGSISRTMCRLFVPFTVTSCPADQEGNPVKAADTAFTEPSFGVAPGEES